MTDTGNPRAALAAAVARAASTAAQAQVTKGWRDQHPPTPHARFDVALTDHWAPHLQRGLGRLWTHADLVAAVATARHLAPSRGKAPLSDPMRHLVSAVAQGSLRATAADAAALRAALRGTWADSWISGVYVGTLQTGHPATGPSAALLSGVDWDAWQPGDVRAAIRTADGALKSLLDSADLRIRGLTETTLRQVGDRIADGLLAGDAPATVARSLHEILGGDTDRAVMIAHTETARAMTAATLDTYAADGIRQWEWLTTDGACPRCRDRETTNPHSLGEAAPPGHPFCRCAVAPVVRLTATDRPDVTTLDLA